MWVIQAKQTLEQHCEHCLISASYKKILPNLKKTATSIADFCYNRCISSHMNVQISVHWKWSYNITILTARLPLSGGLDSIHTDTRRSRGQLMTCSSCGNTISGKGRPVSVLCPACAPIKPLEMYAPVYKDSYGDLWHIGTTHRNSDRCVNHYAIFRRSKKSNCDADCTGATNLTSADQTDSKTVVSALRELAVRCNWTRLVWHLIEINNKL